MKGLICTALTLLLTIGFAEEITLRGGGKIQAPLLKDTSDAIVADLGFDVLRIPRQEILSIQNTVADASPSADITDHLYTILSPAQVTTAEAAECYAPAVVVVKTASGLGSGFFINKEGDLVTNFHVIQGEKHIAVTRFISDGKILRRVVYKDVEIVATAPFHDLAVLRIKDFDTEITPVIFEPDEDLKIGETVFAIGNPLGLERTVTEGVLSQTHRNFGGILYLQVDAPVNPGNSGGPLFNARGQVIGVINMGVPSMEGLNFAIPARHLKYILDHIDAFAYDATNPESGFFYPDPPRRPGKFSEENKEIKHAE
ncbi:S1C family serine protease [Tichowtungia aerotolerans]|uniref:Trypsin-like serine protease n=1 Tax=Tichowtungia aerotolerans TaxID=2697043 RepID=A0A6P1M3W4_9BACT|nr:trypsin-like peptidase domain-containing protein [Tichowtungia aerotolerans]QHI69300.1 trypsin-like serine protease [Tichowtungia aerotolerans]